jgi:hypothetical protein
MLSKFIEDKDAVARLYKSPPDQIQSTDRPRHPNPNQVCIAHLGESVLVRQLNPGIHATKTETACLEMIQERLTWKRLPDHVVTNGETNGRIVSLKKLCQEVLLESASNAVFGQALMNLNPHLSQDFLEFDDQSWKLNYGLPSFLCHEMNHYLEAIRAALTQYIDLPSKLKQDTSWMISVIENEMHGIGFTSRDKASFFASLFWSYVAHNLTLGNPTYLAPRTNSNSWKLAFWMIAYIVRSPELHKQICAEIGPHLATSDSSTELVSKLQSTLWLMATFYETLRITVSSTSVRRVQETCVVANKTLEKHAQVIVPYRQMLMDDQVFGSDADTFNPVRFIENPALVRHQSYRPFGGGVTYCPGRHIAMKEVITVVSLFLGRFRVTLQEPESPFPVMEEDKPCVGVMPPLHNADIKVHVEEL